MAERDAEATRAQGADYWDVTNFSPRELSDVARFYYCLARRDADDDARGADLACVGLGYSMAGVQFDDVRESYYQERPSGEHLSALVDRAASRGPLTTAGTMRRYRVATVLGEEFVYEHEAFQGRETSVSLTIQVDGILMLICLGGTLVNFAHVVSMTPVD